MKKLMIFAISAAVLGVMSCQKSEIYRPGEDPSEQPNGTPVQVHLTTQSLSSPVTATTMTKTETSNGAVSVTFGGDEIETKVSENLTKAEDSKITDLWAIQFDADGKLLGNPYYTEVTVPGTEETGNTDWSYELAVNLVTCTENGKVYFVANTHSPSTFNKTNAATEAAFLASTKHVGAASSEWKFTKTSTIPMIGVYKGQVSSSAAITDVTLTRLFAKIVLNYKVSDSNIEITSVALKNVPATYTYTTEEPAVTDVFPAKTTIEGGAQQESHINYPGVGKTDLDKLTPTGGFKSIVWYMPENYRGQNQAFVDNGLTDADRILSAAEDDKATYIEIKGELKSEAECALLTYTIMLGDPNTHTGDFNVKRNSKYNVTVDIKGANVADHRVTKETFDMNNCAIIAPNGGSVTFDTRKMTAGWMRNYPAKADRENWWVDVLWQDGHVLHASSPDFDPATGLLTVTSPKTGYSAGNAVVALWDKDPDSGGKVLWSWHIWVTSYNPNPTLGTDGHPYPAGQNVAFNTTGGKVHRYGIKFQQTNGNKVIMDRNLGAVNTYYAAPAPSETALNLQNTFGMFYQWGRKDPLPYVDASSINAQNATGTTITIYDGAMNTLDEATGPNLNATGYKRFSIDNVDIAADKWNKNSTLAYSVQNPLTFIYNANTPYDWYAKDANNQNNDLWGDGSVKSPYDPCPKGWRVAPNGTWSDFTRDATTPLNGTFPYYSDGVAGESYGSGHYKATNGRLYKVSDDGTEGTPLAWYPAPGYRDFGRTGYEGVARSVGNYGYSWSCTPVTDGVTVRYLDFNTQNLNPSNAHNRGHGFQLRCLSE